VVGELVVGRIVDQQHVALRADDVAQQLAVVAVGGKEVGDAHAGPDAGKAQHVGGPIGGVAFPIVAAAPGVRDGGVVNIGGGCGAGEAQPGGEQHGETA